ncbi:MAG: hypothetical protein NTV48_02430 [Candidatus Vogelbacteria bacterium]|nr:hypothetical protein [Candidatus Vogelbacteria bacterium]
MYYYLGASVLVAIYFLIGRWAWDGLGKSAIKTLGCLFSATVLSMAFILFATPSVQKYAEEDQGREATYQEKLPSLIQSCRDYCEGKEVKAEDAWWLDYYSGYRYRKVSDVAKSLGMTYDELAKLLKSKRFIVRKIE